METITKPLADAMTAKDLQSHCAEIAKIIGKDAYVTASVDANAGDCCLAIYPDGLCKRSDNQFVRASSWSEIIERGYAWAKARGPVQRNATIRRMALAIIEITDEHGVCIEALLRGKNFSRSEVEELHAAACVRAGEMAAGAPFAVVFGRAT